MYLFTEMYNLRSQQREITCPCQKRLRLRLLKPLETYQAAVWKSFTKLVGHWKAPFWLLLARVVRMTSFLHHQTTNTSSRRQSISQVPTISEDTCLTNFHQHFQLPHLKTTMSN